MQKQKLSAEKYRELFKLRAEGKLEPMECTKSLYKILKKIHFKGMTLLDLPCGVGHYFRLLKDLEGINYTGMDLDPKSVEIASGVWKNSPNAKFLVGGAAKIDLPDSSIDCVISYNLWMHLEDYKEPLKELFRVSKKYIIVRSLFDDFNQSDTFPVDDDYLNVYPKGYFYYNTFDKKEVSKFLESLGRCKYQFINDNLDIPEESLKQQAEALGVKGSEFAKGKGKNKQDWKGLKLNYEVLLIEKN